MYDSESVRRGFQAKANIKGFHHRHGRTPRGDLLWSDWEVDTLKRLYPDMDACCRDLSRRTRVAIRRKAQKLGLTKKRRFWSEREKKVFAKPYASGDPIAEIQAMLDGRTKAQIYRKASKMHLKRPPRWPKSTGLPLVDLILQRAAEKEYTREELNEWSGRRRYWFRPTKYDWAAIAKVLKAMGGEVVAIWPG